jgi:hypothetical protein
LRTTSAVYQLHRWEATTVTPSIEKSNVQLQLINGDTVALGAGWHDAPDVAAAARMALRMAPTDLITMVVSGSNGEADVPVGASGEDLCRMGSGVAPEYHAGTTWEMDADCKVPLIVLVILGGKPASPPPERFPPVDDQQTSDSSAITQHINRHEHVYTTTLV